MLSRSGLDATWWTANFSHHFKQYRSYGWQKLRVDDHYAINLVPTVSYRKNVDLRRMLYELVFSVRLYHQAMKEPRPDCIIAVDPPQIVGYYSTLLSKKFGRIPLVLDVFDQWPELFQLALPEPLRGVSKALFYPFARLRKSNLTYANGIVTLCDTYLEMVKGIVGADHKPMTNVYNGIDIQRFRRMMDQNHSSIALQKREKDLWVVYAGSLGDNYDIETILAASEKLKHATHIQFFMMGAGPLQNRVEEFVRVQQPVNFHFLGKLKPDDLLPFYKKCDLAISAYKKESNVGMPDKAYDYMAAGLPIINSLTGELAAFIERQQVGCQYTAGDPDSLAKCILTLSEDEKTRKRYAENAFKIAENFDANKQYGEYIEFIRQFV